MRCLRCANPAGRSVVLAWLLLGFGVAGAAAPPPSPTVCGRGEAACQGPFGSTCYLPSRGETCTAGLVCGSALSACLGRFGQACFRPSAGETCNQGLVCARAQLLCARGGSAVCYTPSRGETCQ